ncbi:hypothetical protein PS865_05058 [Pseudomonas fluorescens]|uniref:DUF7380 domain-containing protein n=1 Tax=Pseudomonas fluorescens TaxID=294 RepID=UPI001240584C|nr:hypothetical protein [Pseudomonas fluorescens]VVP44845.1 hypothetical protein PS865_05058 [Pseudomonas fluorescens]
MSDQRYPTDLIVTAQDFTGCDWKNTLASQEREGYSLMWHAFSSAGRKASEGDRPSQEKALWLLADACSMMLSPESLNEPFTPFMMMEGRRSVIRGAQEGHSAYINYSKSLGKLEDIVNRI